MRDHNHERGPIGTWAMKRLLPWFLVGLAYGFGWNRGCRAGTTYVRDSWTRAVRRDADNG